MIKKSVVVNEPMDISQNDSSLKDLKISHFECKGNETTKEDVNNINHEMFVFESDLKIKKEFKIERAEGIENQKTEINANEKTKVNKDLKSFKCDDCGKTFKRHTALGNHKRTHGDFKPSRALRSRGLHSLASSWFIGQSIGSIYRVSL